jgi:S-adenosylmethionine-diacylglycerol 3-amino-3-carboxypropyl transferase
VDAFLSTLNYTSVNEDWRTEAEALRLADGLRVLCVTGSGARPLDLLAVAAARVVAVDRNPAQTHLLHLKKAAIELLPYEDYAGFLGLRRLPSGRRAELLRCLGARLPGETRRFWDAHRGAIGRGVLYEGRWERFHRRLARVLRLVLRRRVRALLSFDDPAEQKRWVERHWDDGAWRTAFAVACSAPVVRVLGDPAYRFGDPRAAARSLHARMGALLRRVSARRSFMVALLLAGELPDEDLPWHLTPEGVRAIRPRLDGLEIVTAEVVGLLEGAPERSYDRFSLSDVSSFLDDAGFTRLLAAATRAAAPGARVVLRQFVSRRGVPPSLEARLRRDAALESRLAAEDRSFAYDFLVAEVTLG